MNRSVRVALTLEQCWHRVPGGTAVAAIETARCLARRTDVEPVGIAAAHLRAAPSDWSPPVPVRRSALPRSLLYASWHRLRRPLVEHTTGDVDVVHATTIVMPGHDAPLVVTIHDLLWRRHPEAFTARGRKIFERGLEIALAEASAVMCASDVVVADCIEAGFDRERVRKVPLGVRALEVTGTDVRRVRSEHGLDRPYVLWTGTIEPRKNLRAVIEAFRQVERELDLVVVGPRGWNEPLDAVGRSLGPRLRSLGFVPTRDLGPLYAGAELFCWPSLDEGFGFPVLEAMTQGTPVITSTGTSTEEIAKDAALLVDPRDTDAIAAAMQRLLDDASLSSALGAAGRERAATYTWERTADLAAEIYKELAA